MNGLRIKHMGLSFTLPLVKPPVGNKSRVTAYASKAKLMFCRGLTRYLIQTHTFYT